MKADLERIRKHPSLKDEAYQRIKTLILSDRLSGGDMLDIEWLASGLGISRTPLREALLMLEQEGLIETIPYKGTFVVDVSKKDVEEIYQVREALEPLAVRLAAPMIPDEQLKGMQALFASIRDEIERGDFERYFESDVYFHETITNFVENTLLKEVLDGLTNRISVVRRFVQLQPGYHMTESFKKHRAILQAMRQRDPEQAAGLMRVHLERSSLRIQELAEQGANTL